MTKPLSEMTEEELREEHKRLELAQVALRHEKILVAEELGRRTNLVGHVIRYPTGRAFKTRASLTQPAYRRLIVDSIDNLSLTFKSLRGRTLKKDGTPSQMRHTLWGYETGLKNGTLVDEGEYHEPAKR